MKLHSTPSYHQPQNSLTPPSATLSRLFTQQNFICQTRFVSMTENTNPANFANRLKEEVHQRAAQASHSGCFASMDPDKQVSYFRWIFLITRAYPKKESSLMAGSWTICPLVCNARLLITPTPISKHVPWLKNSANSSPQREIASKWGR